MPNPTPRNNARLSLTSELMDFLDSLPNKKGIPREFIIARDFIKFHKEEFIERLGKEVYEKHIKRYSRNRAEMKQDKLARQKEKLKKLDEARKLKEREIIIKERELDIRGKNTGLRQGKQNEKKMEELDEDFYSVERTLKRVEKLSAESVKKEFAKNKSEVLQDLVIERDRLGKEIEELAK